MTLLSGDDIIVIAAAVSGLKPREVTSARMLGTHVRARMIAALLYREATLTLSLSELARIINKDRTSVRLALGQIDAKRASVEDFDRRCTVAIRIARTWKGNLTRRHRRAIAELPPVPRPDLRVRKREPARTITAWSEKDALRRSEESFLLAVRSAYGDEKNFESIAGH